MADYLTTYTELTSIANAIRTKGGTSAALTYPAGFVSAIQAIPTGGGGLQWVECLDEPVSTADFSLDNYIPLSQLENDATWRITISECYLSMDGNSYPIYEPVNSLNEPLVLTGSGIAGGMPLVALDGAPSEYWTISVDSGRIYAFEVFGADYGNADVYGEIISVRVLQ